MIGQRLDRHHLRSGHAPANRPELDPRGELCRAVEDHLRGSHYSALRDIACDDRGGVLRIHGRLPYHYLKQIAQEMVCQTVGTSPFINEIEVVAPGKHSGASGGEERHEPPGF